MIGRTIHLVTLTKYLLAFIFCGVILGETLSLSMVITTFGSAAVGKMYLVNALLLLLLPVIFFRYIDRINRGKLLANTTLSIVGMVSICAIIYHIFSKDSNAVRAVTVVLYPISYMSKTLLFLTYWTYLNDIYSIQEAKKHFPVIAAWGFGGAVTGVMIGRLILSVLSIQYVMLLWVGVYVCAWYLSKKLRYRTKKKNTIQDIRREEKTIFSDISLLVKNKLVVIIAFIYFGTFVAIFILDYFFWRNCSIWFNTAETLASFQFTFYMVHAILTILLLRYVMPVIIDSIGFTRIMYGLPLLFLFGGILLVVFQHQHYFQQKFIFLTSLQFCRQILFELTFASSYQMFFVVVVREQRGRAKTLLEGIVKPLAIFSSGLLIVLAGKNNDLIVTVIALMGVLLFAVIYMLRLIYIKTIMAKTTVHLDIGEIVDIAGKTENASFYRIVKGFANSPYEDMKILAVHMLKKAGTSHSFSYLVELYSKEKNARVKELVARSIDVFYSYRTRSFAEELLRENNVRIRANVIHALNGMSCNWKKHLKPIIAPLLFENDLRVQIEAAVFLWNYGTGYERNTVSQFLQNLIGSTIPNRQAAGIYLTGLIKSDGWEEILLGNLATASMQVFTKSIEVVFKSGSEETIMQALRLVERMSRKHCTITGHLLVRDSVLLWGAMDLFVVEAHNRRMFFELVNALRCAADTVRLSGKSFVVSKQAAEHIRVWVMKEIQAIYSDASHFYSLQDSMRNSTMGVLEVALRERQLRFCGWAISAMVITDTKGIFVWRSADMDVNEIHKRNDIIEVLESMPQDKVGSLILPLLKGVPWEMLSRMGRLYFHFNKKDRIETIAYFLQSENKLIVYCGLYSIESSRSDYLQQSSVRECLRMLENNGDERIVGAAKHILSVQDESTDKHSRAFELLDRVLFFKECTLFRNISADKLLRVAELAHYVHFEKGEAVSDAGRILDQIFIVKKGVIRVEEEMAEGIVAERKVTAGETFGEASLFAKAPRSSLIVAEETTDVYILKRSDIKRLIRELPDVALNFLEVVTDLLVKSQDRLQMEQKR